MNGEGSRRKVGTVIGEYLLFFQDLNSVPSNNVRQKFFIGSEVHVGSTLPLTPHHS